MWAVVDWDALFDLFEPELVYYVEGDQIYVSDDWERTFSSTAYSISGDLLTLTDAVFAGGTVVELTKIQ